MTRGGIADIVVTATRQSTNLQDTPIAVTAITSEALESRGIQNIGDLTSTVPNAQFRKAQGVWGSGVSAYIRGLGSTDTGLAGQSPVAFYIDDVYYPLLLGANFDLLDMEHIEVLRGPQGTLFGRNSLGGAINIVAKQPNTREASGYVEATVGSYNRIDARAGFNLPLGSTTALMVSVMSKKTEGYQRILDFTCEMNRRGTPALAGTFPVTTPLQQTTTSMKVDDCTIGRNGGVNVQGGRAAFMWQATPTLKFTISGDYLRDTSGNTADTLINVDTAIVAKNTASHECSSARVLLSPSSARARMRRRRVVAVASASSASSSRAGGAAERVPACRSPARARRGRRRRGALDRPYSPWTAA